MPPALIYFDLGNVILHFSHERAARQMAEVAGVAPERVWEIIFGGGLEWRCETGELDGPGLFEIFCRQTGTLPDYDQLEEAGSAIFEVNAPLRPLLSALRAGGQRLGILSNTSASHWNYITARRDALLPEVFDFYVLSYQVGCMKPGAEIYHIAAEQAGLPPERIFFTDDRADNVAGARAAGFDAVQFVGAAELAGELRSRGVECEY